MEYKLVRCVNIWKRLEKGKLLFQWIHVLNSVKHSFSLWVTSKKYFKWNKKKKLKFSPTKIGNSLNKTMKIWHKHKNKNICFFEILNKITMQAF